MRQYDLACAAEDERGPDPDAAYFAGLEMRDGRYVYGHLRQREYGEPVPPHHPVCACSACGAGAPADRDEPDYRAVYTMPVKVGLVGMVLRAAGALHTKIGATIRVASEARSGFRMLEIAGKRSEIYQAYRAVRALLSVAAKAFLSRVIAFVCSITDIYTPSSDITSDITPDDTRTLRRLADFCWRTDLGKSGVLN